MVSMSISEYCKERSKAEGLYQAWANHDWSTLFQYFLKEEGVEICRHGQLVKFGQRHYWGCEKCDGECGL